MYCGICGGYCGFDEQTECGNKNCKIIKKFINDNGVDTLADILELQKKKNNSLKSSKS
jgi:hypothetical protein